MVFAGAFTASAPAALRIFSNEAVVEAAAAIIHRRSAVGLLDPGERLTVWLRDYTDGSKLRASPQESDEEVVITVWTAWQGAHHDIGLVVRKDVDLSRPLGGRRVVDGATGDARPNRALI